MSAPIQQFKIENRSVTPTNFTGVTYKASFDEKTNEGSISTTRFNFEGDDARFISRLFRRSAFEGPGFKHSLIDGNITFSAYSGFLDFLDYDESDHKSENFEDPTSVNVGVKSDFSSSTLIDLFDGVTMTFLKDKNVYPDSIYKDLPWLYEKRLLTLERALLLGATFSAINLTLETIEKINTDNATQAGISTSSATGAVGGGVFRVIAAIGRAVYLFAAITQLILYVKELFAGILSPVRYNKVISYYDLLDLAFKYYGFTFVCPGFAGDFLKTVHINPTIPRSESSFTEELFKVVKVTKEGLPSTQDFGYFLNDAIAAAQDLINGRLVLFNNNGKKELHLRNEEDSWFEKQSTERLVEDIYIKTVDFNVEELNNTFAITFALDYFDDYTIDNPEGFGYEVTTLPKTIKNRNRVNIKGLKRVQYPYALADRKDKLNIVEKLFSELFGLIDDLANAVKIKSNLSEQIDNRVNMMKVSNPTSSLAKLVYFDGSGIPANHRDFLSAKGIYKNFYEDSVSFVANGFRNQKVRVENVQIPFNLRRLLNTFKNSYFRLKEGKKAKITQLDYDSHADYATVSFWLRKVYTKNLKEIEHEL